MHKIFSRVFTFLKAGGLENSGLLHALVQKTPHLSAILGVGFRKAGEPEKYGLELKLYNDEAPRFFFHFSFPPL